MWNKKLFYLLCAIAVGVSAFLMFWIELLLGKSILPVFGGSPQVWPTCLVFFQTALLAGYLLAYYLSRIHGTASLMIFLGLWGGALWANLPVRLRVDEGMDISKGPIALLLISLVMSIGPAFVMLSTTSTLVQRWFHRMCPNDNPYLLYRASNLGSLLGLLAFPFFLEPWLGLSAQMRIWHYGLCCVAAGLAVLNGASTSAADSEWKKSVAAGDVPRGSRRLGWLLYAGIPSALMIAITTHVSLDLAPIPLFWVMPLMTYLLTMILAFGEGHQTLSRITERIMPATLLTLSVIVALPGHVHLITLLMFHLTGLLVIGFYYHRHLYRSRPSADRLPGFYLHVALGGVLGSLFSGFLAPLLFSDLWEYPLTLIGAALLWKGQGEAAPIGWRRAGSTLVVLVVLLLGLRWGFPSAENPAILRVIQGIMVGISVLAYTLISRPRVFAAALLGILIAFRPPTGGLVYASRSFFGTHKVEEPRRKDFRQYTHGSTIHGIQVLDEASRRQATSYFHPDGPAGDVMRLIRTSPGPKRIGVIGLGIGTLVTYGESGDAWTFYEVDEKVRWIAEYSGYFSFLKDSRAPYRIVMGDGRQSIAKESNGGFDLLIVDAFSSDTIPVHLITREAMNLYVSKLTPTGVLLIHISNLYLDLKPVLARHGLFLGREILAKDDVAVPAPQQSIRFQSSWGIVLPAGSPWASELMKSGWRRVVLRQYVRDWTDDYSNLAMIYKKVGELIGHCSAQAIEGHR